MKELDEWEKQYFAILHLLAPHGIVMSRTMFSED